MDGLGTYFIGKAISGGGGSGLGGGETTGIVADSQGLSCAAGGMGFPVTEIRMEMEDDSFRGDWGRGVGKE